MPDALDAVVLGAVAISVYHVWRLCESFIVTSGLHSKVGPHPRCVESLGLSAVEVSMLMVKGDSIVGCE